MPSCCRLPSALCHPETWGGPVVVGIGNGYLCDDTAPWSAGCRPFEVIVIQPSDPAQPRMAAWNMPPSWTLPGEEHRIAAPMEV
jgi:hypothetical protein